MAWIADGKLAAAVSEGGGLGIIAAGNAPGDAVREQIQVAKSLTSRPFGVNIMLMSPFVEEVAQVVAEEKVAVVTTGAGNPTKYMAPVERGRHPGDPRGGLGGHGQADDPPGGLRPHCGGRRERRPRGGADHHGFGSPDL